MKFQWYFFRTGGFSGINAPLFDALCERFADWKPVNVDIVREVIRRSPLLHLRALTESVIRYGTRMARTRIPPRDFFPRLPCVLRAIKKWSAMHVDPARCAFTFQTQSLFDARREGLPHFLYTDHTYLANLRYSGRSRSSLPVSSAWRDMERDLYRYASDVFTSSGFAAESVRDDYDVPVDRVHAVHSGINTPFPASVDVSDRTGRRILFVAVEWERKGGPELFDAFQQVLRVHPDAELHIVGRVPDIRHSQVFCHDRMPVAQVAAHYAGADVFCLPSRVDPSASVLAEAASFALPVVATTVGGNAERVLEGETGFLVSPGNSQALAAALSQLLSDASLRLRMGAAGRRLVQEKFTWPSVAARMEAIIRSRLSSL